MPDAATTELDELFGCLGLNANPVTPEEIFISEALNQSKIDVMRYWLNHEMARFPHMLENGVVPCKVHLAPGSRVPTYRPITALEYGTVAIDYYLDMAHRGWFIDLHNRKALDKQAMIKRILDMPSVKKVIESAENN